MAWSNLIRLNCWAYQALSGAAQGLSNLHTLRTKIDVSLISMGFKFIRQIYNLTLMRRTIFIKGGLGRNRNLQNRTIWIDEGIFWILDLDHQPPTLPTPLNWIANYHIY
jgi:hypothetical protein